MGYVEGFLIPVPNGAKDRYKAFAETMAPVFKELGATRVVECWSDDVPDGTLTDFRRAVKAEADEAVVFAWIEYPSKAVRDAATARLMEDPRMDGLTPPFDGKRMIFGGFAPILDAWTT